MQAVASAPLWDEDKGMVIGMISASDFIHVLRRLRHRWVSVPMLYAKPGTMKHSQTTHVLRQSASDRTLWLSVPCLWQRHERWQPDERGGDGPAHNPGLARGGGAGGAGAQSPDQPAPWGRPVHCPAEAVSEPLLHGASTHRPISRCEIGHPLAYALSARMLSAASPTQLPFLVTLCAISLASQDVGSPSKMPFRWYF